MLIINNDVEFDNTLIEKLIKAQKKEQCSLVTPKMMYYDKPNHIWYAGSWFVKNKGYLLMFGGFITGVFITGGVTTGGVTTGGVSVI